MDVCCESLEAAGASMRPSGSSPAARPPLRHRRRPALAGEGPSLARPTPSLASPPLAGEAHALASEGPSPARVKALAGEAPRQRGPSPRWRGCPRQRGPRPRHRESVRFLMLCGLSVLETHRISRATRTANVMSLFVFCESRGGRRTTLSPIILFLERSFEPPAQLMLAQPERGGR